MDTLIWSPSAELTKNLKPSAVITAEQQDAKVFTADSFIFSELHGRFVLREKHCTMSDKSG